MTPRGIPADVSLKASITYGTCSHSHHLNIILFIELPDELLEDRAHAVVVQTGMLLEYVCLGILLSFVRLLRQYDHTK